MYAGTAYTCTVAEPIHVGAVLTLRPQLLLCGLLGHQTNGQFANELIYPSYRADCDVLTLFVYCMLLTRYYM